MITSILILSGLLSMVSGSVLYFMEYGMWLCFTRKFLSDTHALSGLIMCIAIIAHFLLNRRIYSAEMKALLNKKDKNN